MYIHHHVDHKQDIEFKKMGLFNALFRAATGGLIIITKAKITVYYIVNKLIYFYT